MAHDHTDEKLQAEGTMDELKGKAKQAWGDVTNDSSTEIGGKMDELKGKAKKGLGDAADAVEDAVHGHDH